MIPVIPDFLYGPNDDPISPASVREDDDGGSYVPDALEKVLADSQLAASLDMGSDGRRLVHNLQIAAAERDAPIAAHYRKIAEAATKKITPNAAAGAFADELAKAFSPEGRRKSGLREFLKGRLAEGDTVEAIVAHAQRYDARTANLLREIAAEFAT